MKTADVIIIQQKEFIEQCVFKTKRFVNSLQLSSIEAILLSGSVSRGDYMPGKYGGMIDLTVMKTKGSKLSATDIFGRDEESEIPYHCVRYLGQGFQIAFQEMLDYSDFSKLDEPKKYALLESKILYQQDNIYTTLLDSINVDLQKIFIKKKNDGIGYINYLLSAYKKDRWISRNAFPQLHSNLNKAIDVGIKCLFYNNGMFAPADDRILYYSYSLPKLNSNFGKIISELLKQDITSFEDYKRREEIFFKLFMPLIETG